jgi:hypothetical protein
MWTTARAGYAECGSYLARFTYLEPFYSQEIYGSPVPDYDQTPPSGPRGLLTGCRFLRDIWYVSVHLVVSSRNWTLPVNDRRSKAVRF